MLNIFNLCTSLTSINIPNSVTSIASSAFSGTAWYKNQPDGLIYAGKVAMVYKGDMPVNTKISLVEGTTSIGENAFSGCTGLTSITIPNSVTSIGEGAFSGCTNLTYINIPNSVTSIESSFNLVNIQYTAWYKNQPDGLIYAGKIALVYKGDMPINTNIIIKEGTASIGNAVFKNCIGLTSITIPNSVTSIGNYAFQDCSGLTSVTIPNSVTSIGNYAFYGCSGLTSVTIPNSVTSIGKYAFYGCSGLTSVTIPNSVTSIGEGAFYGCSGLTSITIPNSVTNIGNGTFSGCTGLTSITIPNSVTSIGNSTFWGCIGLTSITIPNNVTNIENYAFADCSGLKSLTIGKSILEVSYKAFANCSKLSEVYCLATTVPNTSPNAFNGSYIGHAKLHVPAESVNSYQAIDPWNNFMEVVALNEQDTRVDGVVENGETEVARYSINGQRIVQPKKGVNIIRQSDGIVRKVMVK